MSKLNSTAAVEQVKDEGEIIRASGRRFGPCSAGSLMDFLFRRCDISEFDDEELAFMNRAGEIADMMSSQLSETINAVACVIDADSQTEPGHSRAGNFEDGNTVTQLLFVIANQIDVVGRMARISGEADFEIRTRVRRALLAREKGGDRG